MKQPKKEITLQNGYVHNHQDFFDIKDVLDKFYAKTNLDKKLLDYEIMQLWPEFIESRVKKIIAENTFAHRITKDRKLVIGVKSAVLASELQFLKAKLEAEFIEKTKDFARELRGLVFELRS